MIVIIFPAGCVAGSPEYLLDTRNDRVLAIIGNRNLFAVAAALMATNNPWLAGVISWEVEIPANTACDIAMGFLGEWLLAGADLAAIPHLIVVHSEPGLKTGTRRTAAHFSVLQMHLGLRKAIRPYVHSRGDYHALVIPFLFQIYNNHALLVLPKKAFLCDHPKIFLLELHRG